MDNILFSIKQSSVVLMIVVLKHINYINMNENEKCILLIDKFGSVEEAIKVALIVHDEVADLPRIPYNERRTTFWLNVINKLNSWEHQINYRNTLGF